MALSQAYWGKRVGQQWPAWIPLHPKTEQLVGVEVEVEGYGDDPHPLIRRAGAHWHVVADGSLRDGVEFVSHGPVKVTDALAHLEAVYDCKWTSSVRTGIHVHADVRPYTWEQVEAIIALYLLCEPAIFASLGDEREQSIYCIPYYRSRDEVTNWNRCLKEGRVDSHRALRMLSDRACKYSALYLEPLTRFGSIEFRMAPTFKKLIQTQQWVQLVADLVKKGAAEGTAANVLAKVRADPAGLANEVLRPWTTFSRADFDRRGSMNLIEQLVVQGTEAAEGWHRGLHSKPKVGNHGGVREAPQEVPMPPPRRDGRAFRLDDNGNLAFGIRGEEVQDITDRDIRRRQEAEDTGRVRREAERQRRARETDALYRMYRTETTRDTATGTGTGTEGAALNPNRRPRTARERIRQRENELRQRAGLPPRRPR